MVKVFNQQFKKGQGRLKETTSNITLDNGDFLILADATAGPITVTLFKADGWGGKRYCIKKIDSSTNVVTVKPVSGETIDGKSSVELIVEEQSIDVISDNENYVTIAEGTGSTVSAVKSFLFGSMDTDQTTNLAIGDHVKFDNLIESRGSDITLDITTAYTTTVGAASIGRLTLKAGRTYKITMSAPLFGNPGAANEDSAIDLVIQDITADVIIGRGGATFGAGFTGDQSSGGTNLFAIFKPTVDTLIEMKITGISNVNSIVGLSTNRASIVLVETI